MAHFGAATPKRHYAYSNSRQMSFVDRGRLQLTAWKAQQEDHVMTAKRSRGSDGKINYQGTSALRGTEYLCLIC